MDFIGTKFNTPKGGILTVVGKLPKEPGKSHPKYQLECSICSKDTELFPELFTSVKGSLVGGCCPCGCAKNTMWAKEQYKILILRKIKNKYEFRGFVGESKGKKSNIRLHCPTCVYEWTPTINSVINGGRGCPSCGGSLVYTKETATAKIMEIIKDKYKFVGFVGIYKNVRSKVKLYCPNCDHEWQPTFNNVIHNYNGCPSCAGNARYTKETATAKIMEIIKDKYRFFGFIGDVYNINTRVKLYCHTCDHEWQPTFDRLTQGRGCPCCAEYGYQISKPGKLYVIKYTTKSNKTFLKYGITNREVHIRSRQHVKKSGTTGEILHVYEFKDGKVPLQIENEIHDLRDEVGYVETSREEFPDGYTETLDVRYEKDVLAIIQKYVQDVPEYEERLCA